MSGCTSEHGAPQLRTPNPSELRTPNPSELAEGVVVAAVRVGTDAAKSGLRAGDRVLGVNGHPLRDAIDFQFHAADTLLRLEVERDGLRRSLTVARARA